jgi:hypothetical protein
MFKEINFTLKNRYVVKKGIRNEKLISFDWRIFDGKLSHFHFPLY